MGVENMTALPSDTYLCEDCGQEISERDRTAHTHYEKVHRPLKEVWGESPCCFPNLDPTGAMLAAANHRDENRRMDVWVAEELGRNCEYRYSPWREMKR